MSRQSYSKKIKSVTFGQWLRTLREDMDLPLRAAAAAAEMDQASSEQGRIGPAAFDQGPGRKACETVSGQQDRRRSATHGREVPPGGREESSGGPARACVVGGRSRSLSRGWRQEVSGKVNWNALIKFQRKSAGAELSYAGALTRADAGEGQERD